MAALGVSSRFLALAVRNLKIPFKGTNQNIVSIIKTLGFGAVNARALLVSRISKSGQYPVTNTLLAMFRSLSYHVYIWFTTTSSQACF